MLLLLLLLPPPPAVPPALLMPLYVLCCPTCCFPADSSIASELALFMRGLDQRIMDCLLHLELSNQEAHMAISGGWYWGACA